jgi:golgin subfamily B member 1
LNRLSDQIAWLLRDPSSVAAARAVREIARAEGDYGAYADAFVERGQRLVEQARQREAVESLVEAALVYEERLGRPDEAARIYEMVLDLNPEHRRALFSLGLILHDTQQWTRLVALYRRRLNETADRGEQTTLHLYIAELLSDRLNDERGAFQEVSLAARLLPWNLRIIGRLERLGERTGQLEEVAMVLGELMLNQDDARIRAALSLRLAELYLGPLDDQERALTYLRAALVEDGGSPELLEEIEDVFRERERFDGLASFLENASQDRRVGPHRVRVERELARIYERDVGDDARALATLRRSLKHHPDDRELIDELFRLGEKTENFGLVADAYAEAASATENALLRTLLRLRVASLYEERIGDPREAVRVYYQILLDEPGHVEARTKLQHLVERLGMVSGPALLPLDPNDGELSSLSTFMAALDPTRTSQS